MRPRKERVSVTLIVPGLCSHGAAPLVGSSLNILERVTARADFVAARSQTVEQVLLTAFGVEYQQSVDLPVAAVTRIADVGMPDDGWWLRADPVCLQPDRGQLVLMEGSELDIFTEESQHLVSEIRPTLEADCSIEAPHPYRWYLKVNPVAKIRTYELSAVANRDIDSYLPYGEDALSWHRWLNEVQMVLHDSIVNENREARGALPVNSLWLWGGGKLPPTPTANWSQVCSDDPVCKGLAQLSNTSITVLPQDAHDWLEQDLMAGRYLVVFQEQSRRWNNVDGSAPSFADSFVSTWVEPLVAAIRSRRLEYVEMWDPACGRFQISRRTMRRWWRRPKSMGAFSHALE